MVHQKIGRIGLCALLFMSCTQSQKRLESVQVHPVQTLSPLPNRVSLPVTPQLAQKSLLWSHQMRGAISGLSASQSVFLVATIADSDIEGSARGPLLSWYRFWGHSKGQENGKSSGALVWQKPLSSAVKEQDLAADGSFAVVSNYSNQIQAWDAHGKLLWSAEGYCRPHILNQSRRVVCYHDDDAEPSVAFELYSMKGEKVYSHPIESDIVAFKIAPDEKRAVMGLAGGHVSVVSLGATPETVWQKQVDGEVVDVAAASGRDANVVVLSRIENGSRRVTLFNSKGEVLSHQKMDLQPSQIGFSRDSKSVLFYGNDRRGQLWGRLTLPELSQAWIQTASTTTDYTYPMTVSSSHAETVSDSNSKSSMTELWIGFEENSSNSKRVHLLGYDLSGRARQDLLLLENSVAYLYTYRVIWGSGPSSTLIVATDDGKISAYRVQELK